MVCYILIILFVYLYDAKRYYTALIIFYFLLLEGFQIVPLNILTFGFYSGSTIDAALFCFLITFVFRGNKWIKNINSKTIYAKAIYLFIGYILLNVMYGLFIEGYSFIDIFRGGRLYLFLLSFLLFIEIPPQITVKISRFLIGITLVQSILFIMQVVLGQAILQGENELYVEDLGYTRFYNTPKLLDFSLALVLFGNFLNLKKKYKLILVTIFIITIIAPLHRGYMFAWVLSYTAIYIVFSSTKYKYLYLLTLPIFVTLMLTNSILSNRINEAIEQLSVLQNIYSNKIIYDDNTFVYRINHFTERINYISDKAFGWLFGIGLLDEKAPQVNDLPFVVGLPSPVTGKTIKVYTPDLVWSMTFLTLGYIGTILYLFIYVRVIKFLLKNKQYFDIYKALLLLILISFLSSFTSNTFIQPHFFVPILMILQFVEKVKLVDFTMSVQKEDKQNLAI